MESIVPQPPPPMLQQVASNVDVDTRWGSKVRPSALGLRRKASGVCLLLGLTALISFGILLNQQPSGSSKAGRATEVYTPVGGTQRVNVVLLDAVRGLEVCLDVDDSNVVTARNCSRPKATQNWRIENGRVIQGSRCLTYKPSTDRFVADPCVTRLPHEQRIYLNGYGRIVFDRLSPPRSLAIVGTDPEGLSVVAARSGFDSNDISQRLRVRSPEFFRVETVDEYCMQYGAAGEEVWFESCQKYGINQTWLFEDDRLAAAGHPNLCLELLPSAVGVLRTCSKTQANQRFYLTELGRIRSIASGRCLVNQLNISQGTLAETRAAKNQKKEKELFGVFRTRSVTFLVNSFTDDCDTFNPEQALVQSVSSQRVLMRIVAVGKKSKDGSECVAHNGFEFGGWGSPVRKARCNATDPRQLWSIGNQGAPRMASSGYCLDSMPHNSVRVRVCGAVDNIGFQTVHFEPRSGVVWFKLSNGANECLAFSRSGSSKFGPCGYRVSTKFRTDFVKETPCTGTLPCMLGQGECTEDDTCIGTLVCGNRNCVSEFGLTGKRNCCTRPTPPVCPVTSASGFANALRNCQSGRIRVDVSTLRLGSGSYSLAAAKSAQVVGKEGVDVTIDLETSRLTVWGKLLIEGVELRRGRQIIVDGASANMELDRVTHTGINANQYDLRNRAQLLVSTSSMTSSQNQPFFKACTSSTPSSRCKLLLYQTELEAPASGSVIGTSGFVDMSGVQFNSFSKVSSSFSNMQDLRLKEKLREYEWHRSCSVVSGARTVSTNATYEKCLNACEAEQDSGNGCAAFKLLLDIDVDSRSFNQETCTLYSSIRLSSCSNTRTDRKITTDGLFVAVSSVSDDYTGLSASVLSGVPALTIPVATLQHCQAFCKIYRDCGAVEYRAGSCTLSSGLRLSGAASSTTLSMRMLSSTAYSSIADRCDPLSGSFSREKEIQLSELATSGFTGCERICDLVSTCKATVVDVGARKCYLLNRIPLPSEIGAACETSLRSGQLRVRTDAAELQFPKFEGFDLSSSSKLCATTTAVEDSFTSIDRCKVECARSDSCALIEQIGSSCRLKSSAALQPCPSAAPLSLKRRSVFFNPLQGTGNHIRVRDAVGAATFEGCRFRCYQDANCGIFIMKDSTCSLQATSGRRVSLTHGSSDRYYEKVAVAFGGFTELEYFAVQLVNSRNVYLSSSAGAYHSIASASGARALDECQYLCSNNRECAFVAYTNGGSCSLYKPGYYEPRGSLSRPVVGSNYYFDATATRSGEVYRDYIRSLLDCRPSGALDIRLNGVEEADAVTLCSRACELYRGCNGFTYDKSRKECLFYKQIVDTEGCTVSSSSVQVFLAQTTTSYQGLKDIPGCLSGEQISTTTKITLEGCRRACDGKWNGERCASFQYNFAELKCVLHRGATLGPGASSCLSNYENFVSTEKYVNDMDGFSYVSSACNAYGSSTGDVISVISGVASTDQAEEECNQACRDNPLCLRASFGSGKCELLSSRADFEQTRCARRCDLAASCLGYRHASGRCELISNVKMKGCSSNKGVYVKYATKQFSLVPKSKCLNERDAFRTLQVESKQVCAAICEAAVQCVSFMYKSSTTSFGTCLMSAKRTFPDGCQTTEESFESISGGFAVSTNYCSGDILGFQDGSTKLATLDECKSFCDNQWQVCQGFTFDVAKQRCTLLSRIENSPNCGQTVYVSHREYLFDRYKLRSTPNVKKPGSATIATPQLPTSTTLARCQDACFQDEECITYSLASGGRCVLKGGITSSSVDYPGTYFKYSEQRYAKLFRYRISTSRYTRGTYNDMPIAECQALCTADPSCSYIRLDCGSHALNLEGEARGTCELFAEASPDPFDPFQSCGQAQPRGYELADLYGYERRIFSRQADPARGIVNSAYLCDSTDYDLKVSRFTRVHNRYKTGGYNPARTCWEDCKRLNCLGFESYPFVATDGLRVLCDIHHVRWNDAINRDASELQALVQTKSSSKCRTTINEAVFRQRSFTRAVKLSPATVATRVFFGSPDAKLARDTYRATLALQRTTTELTGQIERSFDVVSSLSAKFSHLSETSSSVSDTLETQVSTIDDILGAMNFAKLAIRPIPIVGTILSTFVTGTIKTVVQPMKKALQKLEPRFEKGASIVDKVEGAASKLMGLLSNGAMFGVIIARLVSVVDLLTSAYRCAFDAQDVEMIEEIENVFRTITGAVQTVQSVLNFGAVLARFKQIENNVVNPIISSLGSFNLVLNGLSSVFSKFDFIRDIVNYQVTIPGVWPFFGDIKVKLIDLLAPLKALSWILWIFEKPLELLIDAILPKIPLPFLPSLPSDFFLDIDSLAGELTDLFDSIIRQLRLPFEKLEQAASAIMNALPSRPLPCDLDFNSALTRRLQMLGKRNFEVAFKAEIAKKLEGGFCSIEPPRKQRKLTKDQKAAAVESRRRVNPERVFSLFKRVQVQPHQMLEYAYKDTDANVPVSIGMTVCANAAAPTPSPSPSSSPTQPNYLVLSYDLTTEDNAQYTGPECWFKLDSDGQINGGTSSADNFVVDLKLKGNPWKGSAAGSPDVEDDNTVPVNLNNAWEVELLADVETPPYTRTRPTRNACPTYCPTTAVCGTDFASSSGRRRLARSWEFTLGRKRRHGTTRLASAFPINTNRRLFFDEKTFGACQFNSLVDDGLQDEIELNPSFLAKVRKEVVQVCQNRPKSSVTAQFRGFMNGEKITDGVTREDGHYPCSRETLPLSAFPPSISCRLRAGSSCVMNKCNAADTTKWGPNTGSYTSTMYAVEHIYDKALYTDPSKLITNSFANFVMANSGWNSGLGGIQRSDRAAAIAGNRLNLAEAEKEEVYRSDPNSPSQRNYFNEVKKVLQWCTGELEEEKQSIFAGLSDAQRKAATKWRRELQSATTDTEVIRQLANPQAQVFPLQWCP